MVLITQNKFSSLLVIFLIFTLLLNNVKSDSVSFSFPKFGSEQGFNLGFLGDACPSGVVIQLTKRDGPNGTTLRQNSVGRAVYIPPVRLWDKAKGKLADFTTEFSFVVDPAGSTIHADGFSFFIIPYHADARTPKNSSGGYLGLFSPETAFSLYKNQIVAVEFDSFGNEWDPVPVPVAPHIGIDINSIQSVNTAEWAINEGAIGKAGISYNSNTKEFSVLVSYANTHQDTFLTQVIDLSGVMPEWIRIGFSGATGNSVETHDILS